MKENHLKILQTASEILGAALADLVPQGFLLKGGVSGPLFYYDIVLGEELSEAFLPHLENRMKELTCKDIPIEVREMIPSNAADFFRHRRRFYPAHFVKNTEEPLVQVIEIDPFIDYVEGSFLKRTSELKTFKLFKIEARPPLVHRGATKNVFRVLGKIGKEKRCDPLELGKELALFDVHLKRGKDYLEEVTLLWKKEGEALLFKIYQKWREAHQKRGFELVVGTLDPFPPGRFAQYHGPQAPDRATLQCLEKDLIATLREEMALLESLVPLEGEWSATAPEKEKEILQALAIHWKEGKKIELRRQGSFLTVRKNKEFYTIEHSVFSSLAELIIAILEDLEKDLSQKKELLGKMAHCDELG